MQGVDCSTTGVVTGTNLRVWRLSSGAQEKVLGDTKVRKPFGNGIIFFLILAHPVYKM